MFYSFHCTNLSTPWLIPKYIILLDIIVNELFLSLLFRLLIVSIKKCNCFTVLTLYPVTFQSSFISSNKVLCVCDCVILRVF